MGLLDEAAFNRLLAVGCAGCGGRSLVFRTYVDGVVPFMDGEPVARVSWAYDGEKFIDGVYAVDCGGCKASVFSASVCPRCHAPDGLSRALATPNLSPVPNRCADPDCGSEQVRYFAFLPARVTSEGMRADKARSETEPHDNGFHGLRAQCRDCGAPIAVRPDDAGCPLCEAPGPLRQRPG